MDAKEKTKLFEKPSTMPDSTLGYKEYDAAVDKAKEQAKRTPNRNCLG